ncbi:hypothetical protein ABZ642_19785 [Streptomyces sp. NPDC007157]|uniref:hypothetical protein n=1 Tax=Streptomyces sp. NPDC007157 TaxID=3154681 RepID=UPI0033DC2705
MAERPTSNWRRCIAEEAAELAAGTLDPDCACMVELFPEELLLETDAVLDVLDAELSTLAEGDDERIFAAVERVVLALKAVNAAHDECAFETDERGQLCAYIDEALTEQGVDVAALTARRGPQRFTGLGVCLPLAEQTFGKSRARELSKERSASPAGG